jgi:acyl-CoA dehydrogenase
MLPIGVAARKSPWMTDDLMALRDLARTFCAKEIAPHRARWEEQGQVDREVWRKAGTVGLLCLSIPEEYGGGGGGMAHEAVLHEERARVGDTAWGVALHNGVVAHYLDAYGTEDQKRRWLPRMATGEVVTAIAMTEPDAGSDLRRIRTRAVREGDEYVVDGAKTFITNGRSADLVVVVVRTEPGEDRSGLSLLLVETARAHGFRRGPALAKVGLKGQDTCELFFDGVRVPATDVLGGVEGRAFDQMMAQLPRERLVVAVDCVSIMEQALATTVDYVKQRKVFGRDLIQFQNTRMKLAEAATEVTITRTFVDECIRRFDNGELDDATASMAKWWASDRLCRVVDDCVQLFGGNGYMTDYPIARAYADARVQRIFGGTNELMKELIARAL